MKITSRQCVTAVVLSASILVACAAPAATPTPISMPAVPPTPTTAATPSAAPTPVPTSTSTPLPTATPTITPTPTSTQTPTAVPTTLGGGMGRIAFVSNRDDGNWRIYTMNTDGTGITRLTKDAVSPERPAWSPDGKKMAFVAFAPDQYRPGQMMTEVFVMNADGSEQRQLTTGSLGGYANVTWSPDGTKIAFHSARSNVNEIYVMNADGTNQVRLTNTAPKSSRSPVWSPDGKRIAFVSDRGGRGNEIFVMNSDGSNPMPLHGETWSGLTWSPDGTRVVYSYAAFSGHQELCTINADGSGRPWITLTNEKEQNNSDPSWSPDGKLIVYVSKSNNNSDLYVINADGSGQLRLMSSPAEELYPTWQPGNCFGTSTAPVAGCALVVRATQTPGPTAPPTATFVPGTTPTPIGGGTSKIAFQSDRDGHQEIYIMNADGSQQTRLTTSDTRYGEYGSSQPVWSPDGKKFLFVSTEEDPGGIASVQTFSVINADGSNRTRIASPPGKSDSPTWSPDGKKIAFVSNPGGQREVFVMNADGSQPTRLTSTPNNYFSQKPSWSPDSKRIAFQSSRDKNWEIYVMNADGSGPTRLTNNPESEDIAPAWSPDGSKIAFVSNRDGNREIYVMSADGSGVTRLTNDPGEDNFPAWSPDSRMIAFVSNRDHGNFDIYLMNADGSGVMRLTDIRNTDRMPAWQPKSP